MSFLTAFAYFMAFYPLVTAAYWIAGGVVFRLKDERNDAEPPLEGWPPVSLLIPAYNEEAVIGVCVREARELDYPKLEILVLDDGSTDATAAVAAAAAADDPRVRVVQDGVNRGKADRLNLGFASARHELVVVGDADTHIHPSAVKLLVARMRRSPLVAAVAGSPHVTNRGTVISAMQMLEVAAIIGLIRRTQAVYGRVGVVAGVLGLFRRDAVLGVGGYRGEMATEDIDLSWRLLLAGWHTTFEPKALIGMQVPTTVRSLWAQRKRWARGQGEVLRSHLRDIVRWKHRSLWPLALEGLASLVWVMGLAIGLVLMLIDFAVPSIDSVSDFTLVWGIAISIVALLQVGLAIRLDARYDPLAKGAYLLAPIYPLCFWLFSAAAALRTETVGLVNGPRKERVVWNIEREQA